MNKIKSPQSLCASVRERARSKCFPLNVHTYSMCFDNTANSSHTSYISSQFNQARTLFHLTVSLSFNFWINDSRGRELRSHTHTRNTLSTQGLYSAHNISHFILNTHFDPLLSKYFAFYGITLTHRPIRTRILWSRTYFSLPMAGTNVMHVLCCHRRRWLHLLLLSLSTFTTFMYAELIIRTQTVAYNLYVRVWCNRVAKHDIITFIYIYARTLASHTHTIRHNSGTITCKCTPRMSTNG